MFLWCSPCTLYLFACQVKVTVGDSGLWLLLCDVFRELINSLAFVSSSKVHVPLAPYYVQRQQSEPWWPTALMKYYPDDRLPWWNTTLMKDHPNDRSPRWETPWDHWWQATQMDRKTTQFNPKQINSLAFQFILHRFRPFSCCLSVVL